MDSDALVGVLPELGRQHAEAMAAGDLTMIEIEFLNERDLEQRFFRLGSDPGGMKRPVKIELADREAFDALLKKMYGN